MGATNLIQITPSQTLETSFKALQPGDILELGAGTYAAPNYPGIEASGTATQWIVVRGAAGTRPVIDLQNSGELHIGSSYLMLENVEVINGAGNNIHIVPTTTTVPITNVILSNVLSHKMASGVGAAVKMAGNWNNGTGVPTEYVYFEGCELADSIDNAILDVVAVRNCVVRSCWLHSPVVKTMSSPGTFFKGGSHEILIEKTLVSEITGNGAIMVGGDTGGQWFDAAYSNPKIEAVDEVFRNNILADFNDAAFEIRGATNATIYNNTIVSQTSFSIFRFSYGGSGSGGPPIGNYGIDIANNLILTTGTPTASQNDGNTDLTATFGPELWGGSVSSPSGLGLPALPQPGDPTVGSSAFGTVLLNPSYASLTGLADALARYPLATGSPAKNAGAANTVAPLDITGAARPATKPSLGAFE